MTPGEYQVKRERVRGAIAWARELARRSAQTRAIAAELTVIADDICSRARAERERARLLAMERDRADPAVVRLGDGGTPQARTHLSSSQAQTDAAIRQPIRICVSAVLQVCRRV